MYQKEQENPIKRETFSSEGAEEPRKTTVSLDDSTSTPSNLVLLRRVEELQQEKERLTMKVEREENYINNTLHKQLEQLRKEKIDLENALEQEEEFIVNKLQSQLEKLQQDNRLLHEQLDKVPSSLDCSPCRPRAASFKDFHALDHNSLLLYCEEQENIIQQQKKELASLQHLQEQMQTEITRLRRDSVNIQQSAEEEEEFISNTLMKQISALQLEKQHLVLHVEQEEEYISNTLQRRLDVIEHEKAELLSQYEKERDELIQQLHEQLFMLTGDVDKKPRVSYAAPVEAGSVDASTEKEDLESLESLKKKNDLLHRKINDIERYYRGKIQQYEQDKVRRRAASLSNTSSLRTSAPNSPFAGSHLPDISSLEGNLYSPGSGFMARADGSSYLVDEERSASSDFLRRMSPPTFLKAPPESILRK